MDELNASHIVLYYDTDEANGLDPDNDETYNAYCEWRSNNR